MVLLKQMAGGKVTPAPKGALYTLPGQTLDGHRPPRNAAIHADSPTPGTSTRRRDPAPRYGAGVLECVINISEGQRDEIISSIAGAARHALLDVHSDAHHNRSVLTLGGPDDWVEAAARAVAGEAVARLDLRSHSGAHPRIGVLDVVPFVPLDPDARPGHESMVEAMTRATSARNRFASWAADALALPCFLYGRDAVPPSHSLPEVRRRAFSTLAPDYGPPAPHPSAGAVAVGARPVLVAWNLWLDVGGASGLALAKRIAGELRGPGVLTLGLDVGGQAQVSCNLVDPQAVGPGAVFDAAAARLAASEAGREGIGIERCELVGLMPAAILHREDPRRWQLLDLDPSRTIEARLTRAGLGGGRRRSR